MIIKTIFFFAIWLAFTGYAFLFAPPQQPDTFPLITNLINGDWQGINPLIIALFNLMGVLPLMYASFLFIDGRQQKLWAFPFAIFSMGVGAFAILPYLALRQPCPYFIGEKNWLIQIVDSRFYGFILTLIAIALIIFGCVYGDWGDFFQQWQTSRFIHVMSLDFCLLCLLFSPLLEDDIARREIKNETLYRTLAFIPLLGILIYLCFRPPIAK